MFSKTVVLMCNSILLRPSFSFRICNTVHRNPNKFDSRLLATTNQHQHGHDSRNRNSEGEKDQENIDNANLQTEKSKWPVILGTLAAAGALVSIYMWYNGSRTKQELSPRELLTLVVKRGVLAMQKGQIDESQDLFHKALEMAYVQHKQKLMDDRQLLLVQINVFSLMATLAVRAGDAVNAERLYKETMQKCLASGQKPDDESMVELSVKLASLYASLSRDHEAEAGFKSCVRIMGEKVKASGGLDSDTNTLALHGLSLQSYARFLMKRKKHGEAIKLYEQSLETAKEVYGADHPQALVVLNDLASAYVTNRQFEEGIDCYKEAVTRAEKSEQMDDSLVAFYYNLGEACIMGKDFTSAKQYCDKCFEIAKKLGTPTLIQAGQQCLRDVKEVEAKDNATGT